MALESARERAKRFLVELIEVRGYPARMVADYLGLHESQVSRFLRGKVKTKSRLESPEAVEAMERLVAGEGEELFRRWVLARVTAQVMRRGPSLSAEEAREVAERLLPRALEAYRERVRAARRPPS